MSRRGSVLLEAVLALLIFMVGTAALVTLLRGSMESLTRAELEGRLAADVSGIPIRVRRNPEGELERAGGWLRWEPADGAEGQPELGVEWRPEGREAPVLRWRLPRPEGTP